MLVLRGKGISARKVGLDDEAWAFFVWSLSQYDHEIIASGDGYFSRKDAYAAAKTWISNNVTITGELIAGLNHNAK